VDTTLDLVAIGRVSVDLYGQQIGSRLEDVASFARAVGGCPANIAIGAARLELRAALITRVGDEPMGRFVREQLAREGVDTRGVGVDAQRLTPLVLLSVRDAESFPLIFYRENCADSVLAPADVDPGLIASARAVLVTGTHFSMTTGALAQRKAIDVARAHGRKVILDIDYRPNLWGIGGHDAGDSRYARSARVTEALAAVLPDCDLIVGTEEEMHIAAGAEDTLDAVRRIRARSSAVLVLKRGAAGCVVFAGGDPQALADGLVVPGMPIEVYNVLGAGDAFLAGFLRGYLRDAPHETSARYGNACGAIAVSRLLCSSEFPSFIELEHYLAHGSRERALRLDAELNHLHWVTTARRGPAQVLALEARAGTETAAIEAAAEAKGGATHAGAGVGVLLDSASGAQARRAAQRAGLWVAQRVEQPGARPLEFEAMSLATALEEWPAEVSVACRCEFRPTDAAELRARAERNLQRLAAACRAQRRELLLEIGAVQPGRVMARLYELGIRPDWWALPLPPTDAAFGECARAIASGDRYCRGMLVVDPELTEGLLPRLTGAAASAVVRGFIMSGSIAAQPHAATQLREVVSGWIALKDGH
jgi:5-dehydro-2-deoxygluconokinase